MDDELEIIDTENFRGGGGQGEGFSNSQLLMLSLKKCIDAGSIEMREGWINRKVDKTGNVVESYVPDTRLTFIETVETALMIIADDLDKTAQDKIDSIRKELDTKKKEFLLAQLNEWKSLGYQRQQDLLRRRIIIRDGMLHQFFPYYVEYLVEKVRLYRGIVAELKRLIKRMDYYREEFYEA